MLLQRIKLVDVQTVDFLQQFERIYVLVASRDVKKRLDKLLFLAGLVREEFRKVSAQIVEEGKHINIRGVNCLAKRGAQNRMWF